MWRVQEKEESFAVSREVMADLVKRAASRAKTRHMVDAKRGAQELLDAHLAHQREMRRRPFEELTSQDVSSKVQLVGTAKRNRWPTRLSLKLHIASSDLAMRELAEKQERDRWVKEIQDIIKDAGLPIAKRSSGDALVLRVAKGRRANTLRKHVKTWGKVSRWMEAVFHCKWPHNGDCFAEFIEAMVEEPCARSFPESAYKSLMFLEYAGEVPESDQLCRSPAVKNALEEAALRLQSVELRPTKNALLLPVALIMAWETHVCDEQETNYSRIYAWFRLVKLWTGMRFDDTKGTPNRTLEMTEFGLKGIINRSKTSGPGKRIILLPIYVSKEAWLVEREWLIVGWRLWTALGSEAGLLMRDFMLPWPNRDCSGFVRKVVDYAIAATMSNALCNELKLKQGGKKVPMMAPGIGVLWSEHSERVTIRTWSQAARVPEDVRRMIGRWRPSADEGYERNVRINVLRYQKVLAVFVRENLSNSDPFDETMVIQLVEQRMKGMSYGQDEIEEQLTRLMTFMPGEGQAKPCRRPKWTTTGPVILVQEDEDVEEVKAEPDEAAVGAQPPSEEENEKSTVVPVEKIVGTFVVSIVGRSKTRTLHRVGECHRQPGVHYSEFEVLGDEVPGASASAYHRACKQCFRKGVAEASSVLEDESSRSVLLGDDGNRGGGQRGVSHADGRIISRSEDE